MVFPGIIYVRFVVVVVVVVKGGESGGEGFFFFFFLSFFLLLSFLFLCPNSFPFSFPILGTSSQCL